MSEFDPKQSGSSFTTALSVEAVCDAFGRALASRQEPRPQIERHITRVSDRAKSKLLVELLKLELIYRCKEDDVPDPEEYYERFAGQSEAVSTAFDAVCVGDYILLDVLGRGGMGVVHQAIHVRLKRKVAVKILPEHLMQDGSCVARFQREIELVAKLDHPNIVRATDARVVQGTYLLVMDFIEGVNLAELVERHGPLPAPVACALAQQAAEGLDHAHQHGLVHRDVKPSNLMVTTNGQVKLLDLGLARLRDGQQLAESLTQGGVLGTVDYMAPEQWDDSSQVGVAADLYSLGCTLFHLLAGKPPFSGPEFKGVASKMRAHLSVAVPTIAAHDIECDESIAHIIQQLMAKRAEDRPASAQLVARELSRFADNRAVCNVVEQIVPSQLYAFHDSSTLNLPSSESEAVAKDTVDLDGAQALMAPGQDNQVAKRSAGEVAMGVPLILGATTLTISLFSLVLAYYAPWSTAAWGLRFDQLGDNSWPKGVGFAIEAGRSLIFIPLTVFVVWFRFHDEFRKFLTPRYHTWRVNLARLTCLAAMTFFLATEPARHLTASKAPAGLAEWGRQHNIATTREKEWYPYASYLPYSLVAYLVVFPLLSIIPIYAVTRDFARLSRSSHQMASDIQDSVPGQQQAVIRRFQDFENNCHNMCARYLDVLAIVALSLQYEYWIGRLTLTEEGIKTMTFAWVLIAMTVGFLAWITYIYGNAVESARQGLTTCGSTNVAAFGNEHNALSFVKWTLIGRLSGVVILSLVLPLIHSMIG